MRRVLVLVLVLLLAASAAPAQDGREAYRTASPATARVEVEGSGHGAGFVVDPSGLVATCFHLLEVPPGLDGIRVELPGGPRLPARVVAIDGRRDVAILAVDAGAPLPALALDLEGPPEPGAPAFALGHPRSPVGELRATMTSGVVSGPLRSLGGVDHVQTDAAIHAGASGGPLVDGRGRVVGMIAIHAARQPGIAFALAASEIRAVLDRVAAPGAGSEEDEVRRVAGRWLDLLADARALPAADLVAPFYWHHQIPVYEELLARVTAGGGDEALRREFAAPHSARLIETALGAGVTRPAIQRYLVERAAIDLGRFRRREVREIVVREALADAIVRLDDRERAIRLVRDAGAWCVVPFPPPSDGPR